MQGWIKLHRRIVDWEWYDDLPTKSLFIHLLILANHEDNMWHGKKIEKGSLVTSVASLSAQTGLSIKQIRTALNHLEKTGEIGKQTTNQNTLIIILNYSRYQEFDTDENSEKGKQGANKGQARGKQRATNKNDKNDKNVKNDKKEIDYSAVAETYNSICKSLPEVKMMTDTRKTHLKSFLDILKKHDLTVDEYFRRVQDSDFLSGRNGKWTNCSFDWLINKSNAVKVCEGTYKNTGTAVQTYCEY